MILVWRPATDPDVWTLANVTNYLDLCDQGLKPNLCVPAPQPFPSSTLEIETEGEPADFIWAGSLFVVSGQLRAILDNFQVNAEFFQLKVIHKGEIYQKREFYFANLLDAVACLDYEKSKYETTPFGVSEIAKLVLDDSKAAGRHLFLVGPIMSAVSPNPKAIRDVIYAASEELAVRVIESGLTGAVFTRPKDRRDYPPPAWRPA